MSQSKDVRRRRLLCGVSLAILAVLIPLDTPTGLVMGNTPTIGRIAAVGFGTPLLMASLIGSVFAITQILRGKADLAGLIGGALVLMGWTAGVRIIALRQLHLAVEIGTGWLAPDTFDRLFTAAPVLWRSIVPSGILFPIGMVILGLTILVTAPVPRWIGAVMVAGGVLFPIGRIAQVEWALASADMVLAAGFALLSWQVLSRPEVWSGNSVAADGSAASNARQGH